MNRRRESNPQSANQEPRYHVATINRLRCKDKQLFNYPLLFRIFFAKLFVVNDYANRFRLVFATGNSVDDDSFAFINGAGNLSIFGIEGSGIVVLTALGAAYLVGKKRHNED